MKEEREEVPTRQHEVGNSLVESDPNEVPDGNDQNSIQAIKKKDYSLFPSKIILPNGEEWKEGENCIKKFSFKEIVIRKITTDLSGEKNYVSLNEVQKWAVKNGADRIGYSFIKWFLDNRERVPTGWLPGNDFICFGDFYKTGDYFLFPKVFKFYPEPSSRFPRVSYGGGIIKSFHILPLPRYIACLRKS